LFSIVFEDYQDEQNVQGIIKFVLHIAYPITQKPLELYFWEMVNNFSKMTNSPERFTWCCNGMPHYIKTTSNTPTPPKTHNSPHFC